MIQENTQAKQVAMTVAAAALELGVTVQSVYRWLEDDTLTRFPGVAGGVVLVDARSVEQLKAQREEGQQ